MIEKTFLNPVTNKQLLIYIYDDGEVKESQVS